RTRHSGARRRVGALRGHGLAPGVGATPGHVHRYDRGRGGHRVAVRDPAPPLELAGRDVYIAEGCFNCHSQMIRPFRHETERYGEYSKPGEFVYDHPFLWGSRRIGPDLARIGGKYPDLWHVRHMQDPRAITAKSIMPSYPE